MFKSKIILTVLLGGILIFITTIYLNKNKLKPVSHAAVKVVLDQTPDYSLSLKSLSGESSYAPDYKLPIPYGYYNVKIFGDNGLALFSGKVEKNRVSFPPYEVGEKGEPENAVSQLEALGEMTLLLPYFSGAKKIIFYDENNLEKLQVNIENISLPKDYPKKLCGNGICDLGENILFCYQDCRPRK
ncbi:hypothetical protein A3D76_03845 [Candidatus Roizmanbacteria bacterium RIFCSPHIGHO2_02_FULL_37_9b]|nr:MAG: hypothetical protein A3D76_03845 [Candidatus Roizmanbacteria bacterium RIFCSPHIGHO2_02_FULL_37_9b]